MQKKIVPEKWLLIILLFTLLEPFHYFLLINFPLEGRSFLAYDADEGLVMGLMRAVDINFENPWSTNGEKIYNNPALTSPYPQIILGFIRDIFNLDTLLLNIIAKAILTFVLLIVVYNIINFIVKDRKKADIAFLLFLMPLGLQPFLFLISIISGIDFLGAGLSHEFFFINSFSRVYYYVPFITAFLSFLMFAKAKRIYSIIFLGITILIHPGFGFAAMLIIFLYQMNLFYKGSLNNAFLKSAKSVWKIYLISGLFIIPWIISSFQAPELFALYKQNNLWWRAHLFSIVGSYFFLLAIIFIANMEGIIRHKKFVSAVVVLSAIVSINELHLLNVPYFNLIGIPENISIISEVFLLIFFTASCILIFKSRLNSLEKFLAMWVIIFIPMSIVNPAWVLWAPYRFPFFMRIPIVILAALYLPIFFFRMQNIGIKKMVIVVVLAILSLSSFLIYNYRFQESPRRDPHTYYYTQDYNAMKYLDNLPQGLVLASSRTYAFLPALSGKRVLYHPGEAQYHGGGPDREQKKEDVLRFFSGSLSENEAKEIIIKYGIDYVLFGEEEKKLGDLNPDSYSFLENIYNKNSRIYTVAL